MAQVCGIHRGVLRAVALCAAVAAFAWTAEPARADGSPPRPSPQPQNLWHAYPLDNGSRASKPSRAARVSARSSGTESGRSAVLLWVAVAAFGAAVVAFAVSRRSGRVWPLAVRLRDQRLALAGGGPAVEVEAVSAARPSAATKELPSERSLLKRKRAEEPRSEAKTLKEKKRRTAPARPADDVSVLRAKLAASPPQTKREPVAEPARLRPVPATRCHIGWWRGYVKSEFQAYSAPRERERAVVATSPPFRWSKAEPPPEDLAEAVSALAALRRELEAAGWVATGTRGRWFAIEFERRPNGGGRGKADHEQ